MTASDIIAAFGGTSALARSLGCPISTVHSWRGKNYIPRWWQREILTLALEQQKNIAPTDFPAKDAREAA